MSGSYGAGQTLQQIADGINIEAKGMFPYNQNTVYDNGHTLGENVFQFFPSKYEQIYGTVTAARIETSVTGSSKIVLTVNQFAKPPIELCVRKERAAQILYKLKRNRKYINFITERFQAFQEVVEQGYKADLVFRVAEKDAKTIRQTEEMDLLTQLGELYEQKQRIGNDSYDAQIYFIKWKLHILEDFFKDWQTAAK